MLIQLLTLWLSTSVGWACAGISGAPPDRSQCDGWLVVDGSPVLRFWTGTR